MIEGSFAGRARASLALLACLALTACASGSSTLGSGPDRVALDRDAAWALLAPRAKAGGALAAASVQVLAETRLRTLGVERLDVERAGRDGTSRGGAPEDARIDAALERARADGYRYAVVLSLEEWVEGALPEDAPRVTLSAEVHGLAGEGELLRERAVGEGRAGASLTATADGALAALLDDLPLVGRRGPSRHPDVVRPEGGATEVAVVEAVSTDTSVRKSSLAPSGSELRTTGPGAGSVIEGMAGASENLAATAEALEGRATAFFYGTGLPLGALGQFDRVVLEPDNVTAAELAALRERGAATFAYLSVGEVGPERDFRTRIDARWILGRNEAWNSDVMDLAGGGWRTFLDERVDSLVAAGYDGLFLDTMDSYVPHATTPADRAAQAEGLGAFVRQAKARHPELRLIANRGFEVLDVVAPALEAIAAESLYARWDNEARTYSAVPADDREWLLGQLERASASHGLDVIAIDYLPPRRREAAGTVAARIAAHGFVPWVSVPSLDHVGVGAIDVLPREVMLLFDSSVNGELPDAEVHRLLATPIEYLGYVAHYHDLARLGVPPANLAGRFAGVVHWSRGDDVPLELQEWFESVSDAGVPLALFGVPWMSPSSPLAERFGITVEGPLDADSARPRTSDALIGFERPLPPRLESVPVRVESVGAANAVHLGLEDGEGRRADLVLTNRHGGLAFHPGVVERDIDDVMYWIVDPFAFLRRALSLPDAPMPDVTSENGRRLWMAHIDGDALPSWAELPGRRLGAELIRERILERHPLPHTVSAVEAEMTRLPAYADRRKRMFAVMRDIFAMPGVDIASHSFSHPFDWADLAAHGGTGVHNLPVAGYRYSPEREIAGSAAFIDRLLAPSGKRTRVMLWSGSALPGADELEAAQRAELVNVNGGFTTITRARPALSLVAPMARTVGEHVQLYAPIMNENVYTNDWRGPFDGYRRVIETFELTDRPRRLKPLGIYYHFYAGTKEASLRSLEEVYAWSLAQDVHPVSLLDYASRVQAFRTAGVARRLDGSWRVHGLGSLRSVRVLGEDVRLDGERSAGVRAARRLHDALYLQTEGEGEVRIALEPPLEAAHPATRSAARPEPRP